MPKEGDRIELVYTDDPYTKLKKGDRGTVLSEVADTFHPSIRARIHINWDSGSKLTLLDPIDRYKIIKEEEDITDDVP